MEENAEPKKRRGRPSRHGANSTVMSVRASKEQAVRIAGDQADAGQGITSRSPEPKLGGLFGLCQRDQMRGQFVLQSQRLSECNLNHGTAADNATAFKSV